VLPAVIGDVLCQFSLSNGHCELAWCCRFNLPSIAADANSCHARTCSYIKVQCNAAITTHCNAAA
jgi:hypothetical protein